MKAVADLCLEIGAIDVYIVDTEERKKAVWSARGAFLEAIKSSTTEMDECDVVVPVNKVDEFIKFTHSLSEEMNVRIPSLGYAKKDYLKNQLGDVPIGIMQGIKKVFDEKNILNPGKICF